MSYCFNPDCQRPQNPTGTNWCQSCGSNLLLRDRYRILKLIGQGGFGRTFLTLDENDTSKPYCVIKQFLPQTPGIHNAEKAAELFQQEAARLEELGKHPQIPQFIAYFEQDNHHYLVQEFIDGPNLAQVLQSEGAFGERQIRDLLNSLLPVLQFIHSRNIIHRDIKPENIIRRPPLYPGTKGSRLVLVDFGAAKYIAGTPLSRTGTVIGSAGYAAPEQVAGKAIFASDLYSLGVTCLHLLTQAEPFDLYSFSEAIWVWRDYLSYPVSRQLRQVLDKMVEVATGRRYQSASEVLIDLNSHLTNRTPRVISGSFSTVSSASSQPIQNWRCVYTLQGHTKAIRSLSITPDGQILASGSDDKTIKLWQLTTGQKLGTLRGHSKSVCSIAISADGQILASGSEDKTIKFWQLSKGLQIGSITLGNWFSGDEGCVYSIAISPDGQILASLSHSGTVKLWQMKTGQEIYRLKGDTSWIQAIAISPDGQILAGGSGDTIKLWHLKTGRCLPPLKGHKSWVRTVAFAPDSQVLASGSDDATIKLWDVKTRQELCTLTGHTRSVYSIAFSPVGAGAKAALDELAFSVSNSKSSTDNFTQPFSRTQNGKRQQIIASSSDDQTIKLWDLSTGQELCTLTGHTSWVHAIAFTPDGQTLVSGGGDSIINIWQHD